MPLAQQMFLFAVAALAIGLVLFFAFRRPKWREELGDTGDLDTHIDLAHPLGDEPRRVGKHPAFGASYRDGPTLRYGERDNWPTKQIVLTPRHLEHINIRRRREGAHPMSAAGFRAAISDQARTGINPIHSKEEWLTYLVAAQVLFPEHQSHRVAVDTTIAIEPDAPFNGQFGDAGATSSFYVPDNPYTDLGKAATRGLAYGSAAGLAAALHGAALVEPCSLHDGSLPPPGGAAYPGNAPQAADQPQADQPDMSAAPASGGPD